MGDFSSVLAILLGCGLDAFLGLATPKLLVPTEFKVRVGQDEKGKRKWGQKLGVVRRFIYPKLLSLLASSATHERASNNGLTESLSDKMRYFNRHIHK